MKFISNKAPSGATLCVLVFILSSCFLISEEKDKLAPPLIETPEAQDINVNISQVGKGRAARFGLLGDKGKLWLGTLWTIAFQ